MTNKTETEKKAYALGIVAREFNVDFDAELPQEQLIQINNIADDAILDEPKTDIGKDMKKLIDTEQANSESEYNKGFNFHKDLNGNKINPAAVFIFQVLAKYADRLIDKDPTADAEMLSDLVTKFNDLGLPSGYTSNPFQMVAGQVSRLNAVIKGQVDYRKDEIEALSVGIKHPRYGTLSPHLASLRDMDAAIKRLRETFNYTEEDYRKSE